MRRRTKLTVGDKFYLQQNIEKPVDELAKFLNADKKAVAELVDLLKKDITEQFDRHAGTLSQTQSSSEIGDVKHAEEKGNYQQPRFDDIIHRIK